MADHNSIEDTSNSQDHTDDRVISSSFERVSDEEKVHSTIKIPLPSIAAHSRPCSHNNEYIFHTEHSPPSEGPTSSQTTELLTEDPLVVDSERQSTPSLNPRHTKLQGSITLLETQIAEMQEKLSQTLGALRDTATYHQKDGQDISSNEVMLEHAQAIVTKHIKSLHQYNEIKDVGLGLMGLIAEKEGKRLGEVMDERGVDSKD